MVQLQIEYALVAQLDRASDSGSEGWGFESSRARHCRSGLHIVHSDFL